VRVVADVVEARPGRIVIVRRPAGVAAVLVLALLVQSAAWVAARPTPSSQTAAIGESAVASEALAVGPERPGAALGIAPARERVARGSAIGTRRVLQAQASQTTDEDPVPHARSHTVRHAARSDDPSPH
jgi:hypothetical protein